MLKKTITYKNYNDVEVKEDFYFNLSEGDLIEMQIEAPNHDMSYYIDELKRTSEGKRVMEIFHMILARAYGLRSADGRDFWHDEMAWRRFKGSRAYDQLLIELISKPGAANAFIEAIMPAEKINEARKKIDEMSPEERETFHEKTGDVFKDSPAPVEEPPSDEMKLKAPEDYSRQELLEMSAEKFKAVAGTDPMKMQKRTLEVAFERRAKKLDD